MSGLTANHSGEQPVLEAQIPNGIGGKLSHLPPTPNSMEFPFLSKPDGSWVCRYCCSVPPRAQQESSVWKANGGLPPTADFVASHLRTCPGTPVCGEVLTEVASRSPSPTCVTARTVSPTTTCRVGPPRAHVYASQGSRVVTFTNSQLSSGNKAATRREMSYHCISCNQHFDRWKPCREHMRDCCPEEVAMRSKKGLRRVCYGDGDRILHKCKHCGQQWRQWIQYSQHLCYARMPLMNFTLENYDAGMNQSAFARQRQCQVLAGN